MKTPTLAAIAALTTSAPVMAQDWVRLENPPRGMVVASTTWPSGISIIARCDNDVFDVILPVVEKIDGVEAQVTFAFDDIESVTRTWPVASNGTAVFVETPTRFVRALRSAQTLKLTIDDGSPPLHRYELDIDGETSPLVDVMEACDKPLIDARDSWPLAPDSGVTWLQRPTPRASDYPSAAINNRISGRATVSCVGQPDGRLDQCLIEGESPPHFGFGEAAIKVVKRGRISLPAVDPEVGFRPFIISVTIPFSIR